jgi:hypothetical protein
MDSKDGLRKIRVDTGGRLSAIPRILEELDVIIPLLSAAYSTGGRRFGYDCPHSIHTHSLVRVTPGAGARCTCCRNYSERRYRMRDGCQVGWSAEPAFAHDGVAYSFSRAPRYTDG